MSINVPGGRVVDKSIKLSRARATKLKSKMFSKIKSEVTPDIKYIIKLGQFSHRSSAIFLANL